MKITDVLNIDSINVSLIATDKNTLIAKMLDLASATGKVLDVENVRREILIREEMMSTGIGKGIALPHAKTDFVTDTVGAFAVLQESIEYESLDGSPINIVFLLIGRENNVGNHLRLLSKIVRIMSNDAFRHKLLLSQSPNEAIELFKSLEE